MAEKNRKGFRTVADAEMEEYNQKLLEHRKKVAKRVLITVFSILLVVVGVGLFLSLRHYEKYDIMSTTERSDTEGTKFEEFRGNILKYSNDGAFYVDASNELIWNQTYEMSDPQIDICEKYLVIYDKKGTMIYILTPDGLQGSIETTMPIDQVCVAAQGTIAVLMQKNYTGYFALYDKTGGNLAQGEFHGEKKGYPIAIALSHDALKMAVSMVNINDGTVRTTLAFYNYGSVGQNEIDNCVGVSTFSDMIIPELEFVSDDRMIAFGDTELMVFEGSQKPQLSLEIPLEKQARSMFYNDNYIGVVTSNEDEEVTHHITVYDTKGDLVMEKDIEMDYETIEFMSNDEICIRNENVCDIYTLHKTHKFHYEFESDIYKVIPGNSGLNYTLLLKDATEKVRLK